MNFLINYFLKALLNIVIAVFVMGICAILCSTVLTADEINTVYSVDALGKYVIQYVPHVGQASDYIISLFGMRHAFSVDGNVNLLSEVTFAIILTLVYNGVHTLHNGVKRMADRIAHTLLVLKMFNDVIGYLVIVYTSIAASVMLNAAITKLLAPYGQTMWVSILILSICAMVGIAIWKRSLLGVVKLILDVLIGIVNLLLIQLVAILMNISQNAQYATSSEMMVAMPCLILGLLIITCYASYLIASIAKGK